MKFNSTSNILIVSSILTLVLLYFVGLAANEKHDLIMLGNETSFLIFIIGYTLKKKNIQQLIGLFAYIVFYNLKVLIKSSFFIQNENALYLINHYNFYIVIISLILILPTTFEKYHFKPLTDQTNIKDSIIIVTTLVLTIVMQALFRLLL